MPCHPLLLPPSSPPGSFRAFGSFGVFFLAEGPSPTGEQRLPQAQIFPGKTGKQFTAAGAAPAERLRTRLSPGAAPGLPRSPLPLETSPARWGDTSGTPPQGHPRVPPSPGATCAPAPAVPLPPRGGSGRGCGRCGCGHGRVWCWFVPLSAPRTARFY